MEYENQPDFRSDEEKEHELQESWQTQLDVLQANYDSAVEDLKNSNPQTYAQNIRNKDIAKKELDKWLEEKPNTLAELDLKLERAHQVAMRAMDSEKHNEAMREVERLLTKIRQVKDEQK